MNGIVNQEEEILIQKLTTKSCSSATNLSSVGKYLSEKSSRTRISCNICICFGKLYLSPLNISLPFIAFTQDHDWMMQSLQYCGFGHIYWRNP